MSMTRERVDSAMLHPELRAEVDPDAIIRGVKRISLTSSNSGY
jgi:hypothetical protein